MHANPGAPSREPRMSDVHEQTDEAISFALDLERRLHLVVNEAVGQLRRLREAHEAIAEKLRRLERVYGIAQDPPSGGIARAVSR